MSRDRQQACFAVHPDACDCSLAQRCGDQARPGVHQPTLITPWQQPSFAQCNPVDHPHSGGSGIAAGSLAPTASISRGWDGE